MVLLFFVGALLLQIKMYVNFDNYIIFSYSPNMKYVLMIGYFFVLRYAIIYHLLMCLYSCVDCKSIIRL